jgi:hypothetical protein
MVRMNSRTEAHLDRAERYLAREQILRTLGRLPDPELARIAAARDTEALAACGVTDALLRSAVGDTEDPEETERRLSDLFAPLRQRADRLRPFLNPEVEGRLG